MSEFYKEKSGTYHFSESPERKFDEFYGNGWKVFKQKNEFFCSYISGELAGKGKTIEIDQEDFCRMRDGIISIDELCVKYDVC